MNLITAEDYLEYSGLKAYAQDALRLVLTARPEHPLDLIHDYLRSVLAMDNVVGREYAYINATMRNRRAFIITLHELFVAKDPMNTSKISSESCGKEDSSVSARARCGFEQQDLVQLVGLVCPDFSEDIIGWVTKILAEGSKNSHRKLANSGQRKRLNMSFKHFLRAFSIYFYYQEFFHDVRVLFSSVAAGSGGNVGIMCGENARRREVKLRVLLDQLRVMEAEPQNQLRYINIQSIESAIHRGGLGERVTLPMFMACLLLHSDAVAAQLLEKPTIDTFSDRLETDPSLWDDWDGLQTPQQEDMDNLTELTGRKKVMRKGGSNGPTTKVAT